MKTFFIIIIGICNFCLAQNAKQEILNINKAFIKNTSVAIQVTTKSYSQGNAKAVSETKMEYYKDGNNSLQKTEFTETLINENYKLNIDTKRKNINVSKLNPTRKHITQDPLKFDDKGFFQALDTALLIYKDVQVKSLANNVNELSFVFKKGMYDIIKINYDKSTYNIYDYSIKLNTNNSAVAKYKITSYIMEYKYFTKDVLKKQKFSEKDYVIINKGEITPSKKYNGYTIFNNIKKG